MNGINDREKVIKGLREAYELIMSRIPERRMGYAPYACLNAMQMLAEKEQPMSWVSVEDRLPENTNHVLALCEVRPFKKLYKCIAMYVRPHELSEGKYPEDDTFFDYDEDEDEYYLKPGWYEIGRNFGEYGSAVIEDFVTHWMPLPEPPEEVSGDAD